MATSHTASSDYPVSCNSFLNSELKALFPLIPACVHPLFQVGLPIRYEQDLRDKRSELGGVLLGLMSARLIDPDVYSDICDSLRSIFRAVKFDVHGRVIND